MAWIAVYCTSVSALVLVAAGVAKLLARARMTILIDNYDLLPRRLSPYFGAILPWAEVVTGALLFLRIRIEYVAVSAALLFLMFAGAIAINLIRGREHIPCGCFGASEAVTLKWRYVLRNIALGAAAAWGGIDALTGTSPARSVDASVWILAAVTLACWWLVSTSITMIRRVSLAVGSVE